MAYEISMFCDRSSNLNPFQSGRPTRFAPCWLDATLHIEELLLHGSTTQVPVISLRLNSNVVLALPHHPIIIRGCKEFQSRIPGLEGGSLDSHPTRQVIRG